MAHDARRCPYLRLEADPDLPTYLLEWLIDPEYYLFEGCMCSAVSKQSWKREYKILRLTVT